MNENGKSWLVILLCAAGIALLAGLGYALREHQNSNKQSSDRVLSAADDLRAAFYEASTDPPETPALSLTEAETSAPLLQETENDPRPAKSAPSVAKPVFGRIIFVGDSRTVGMQRSVDPYTDPCIFIAASGEGYLWFERSGIHRLERSLLRYPDVPVVFNLGVNDTVSIYHYIRSYRALMEKHPDTSFWFLSVNPVTEESLMVPDTDVVEFNHILKEAFPHQYLDSYSWLKKNGFESVDGIHYSEETYLAIHDFVFSKLFSREEETETLAETELLTEAET